MVQEYSTFFCQQGLEKTCKAYLLGCEAQAYESKPDKTAQKIIDSLVKDKKIMGHNLEEMIKKLISKNVLEKDILLKISSVHEGRGVTSQEIILILDKAYLEARYPVPYPVHEGYPIVKGKLKGKMWWGPIRSSDPRRFAFDIGYQIIIKIEKDFGVSIPRNSFSSGSGKDWERFCNIFFV